MYQNENELASATVTETREKAPREKASTADQATAPERIKNFVIDTNVLVHDPQCINRFENNHVFLPVDVLSELDKFKNEQTERGANARQVHRQLSRIFEHRSRRVTRGVATPGGGTLRILLQEFDKKVEASAAMKRFLNIFPDQERMDHRIIRAALALELAAGVPSILVTKDLNMQLKALALGLQAQDYLNDKVEVREAEGDGLRIIEVEKHELQRFGSARSLELSRERSGAPDLNEYVLLATREGKQLPARHLAEGNFVRLNTPPSLQMPKGIELSPLNAGQQCFLDALLDPEISLVTCYGQAGTGKTLLAVAAGLHLTEMRQFVGMTVSRPVVAMGNTLGFLPGTLNEKMHPWLQSVYDALEFLLPLHPPPVAGKKRSLPKIRRAHQQEDRPVTFRSVGAAENGVQKPYEKLIDRGLLEIEALCYIRGRSIPNRFFVLDEAQQLTPLEAKTIVTRMSQGSKLVLVGDPGQIDNPYVDQRSNGLVYTKNRLKTQAITAHISLTKGERSPLAQLGAGLM